MDVGGPADLIRAVKTNGGRPGYLTWWEGSWTKGSGYGGFDRACDTAKSLGTGLMCYWFYFGDHISPQAITTGKADALAVARELASHGKEKGVSVRFVVDNEFNKSGTEGSQPWHDYFNACAKIFHDAGHQVVYCPGLWCDPEGIAQKDAPLLASIDAVSMQSVIFRTRNNDADYAAAPQKLYDRLTRLMTATRKPGLIADVLFSSYGGNFSPSPPFPGGDGRAYETQQKAAIDALVALAPKFEAAGVTTMCYRALQDDPNFPLGNYGGYAERSGGVIRSDGTKKPAHDSLMRLASSSTPASTPTPTPAPAPTPTPAPDPRDDEIRSLKGTVADLQGRLDAVRKALGPAP